MARFKALAPDLGGQSVKLYRPQGIDGSQKPVNGALDALIGFEGAEPFQIRLGFPDTADQGERPLLPGRPREPASRGQCGPLRRRRYSGRDRW